MTDSRVEGEPMLGTVLGQALQRQNYNADTIVITSQMTRNYRRDLLFLRYRKSKFASNFLIPQGSFYSSERSNLTSILCIAIGCRGAD